MLPDYILHKSDQQGVVVEYNTVLKHFPDGTTHVRYTSFSNLKGQSRRVTHDGSSTDEELERYNTINLIRRRQNISDLAYANGCDKSWQYFVTLTFDDKFIEDSYSHEKVTKYLTRWLNNQKHQNPEMRYLLVPELHKSGRIHFHGVFSDVPNWNLVPGINSKTGRVVRKKGKIIYNLTNYKLGFTTVSEVENIEAVSHYISKYITKELLNLKNKRNVWHSKNLIKPEQTFHVSAQSDIELYLGNREVTYIQETDKENYNKLYVCSR